MKRGAFSQKKRYLLEAAGIAATGGLLLIALFMVLSIGAPKSQILANGAHAELYDDVQYCGSDHPKQQMDILVPQDADNSAPAPVVFYVHGGGWKEGSFRNNIDDYYPQFLINKNIAFVTVDYRLAPEASYPTQDNDINCAYTYLKQNAAEYDIDMSRVGFFGDSAGGQLATMQSLRSDVGANAKAVAMLYAVSDLWYQITQKNDHNALLYLGNKRDEGLANKASPFFAPLDTKAAFLLIHGTGDTIVPQSNSERFYDRLKAQGINAQLVLLPGAGHGFGDAVGSKEQAEAQPVLTNFFVKYLEPAA
jgi:acetyl esterase/lipase